MPPRVCYLLSHYISHRQAGLQNIACLRELGVMLVDTPAEADIVIIHNEPWSVAGYYRVWPELRDKPLKPLALKSVMARLLAR